MNTPEPYFLTVRQSPSLGKVEILIGDRQHPDAKVGMLKATVSAFTNGKCSITLESCLVGPDFTEALAAAQKVAVDEIKKIRV